MKTSIKLALAALLTASSLGGVAVAQTAAPMAAESVTVVRIDSLDTDSDRQEFERLNLIATDATRLQQAQAEISADPVLMSQLSTSNVQLQNVVEVKTAANGGKIVYVR